MVVPFSTIALGSTAAQAQELAAECTPPRAPVGELAPWTAPTEMTSAARVAQAGEAPVRVGQAVELGLRPVSAVRYPLAAEKVGGQGGLAEVTIETAGTYAIALGSAAWIDVIVDGKPIASTAHGHGEPCTGIRKIVEFPLPAGRHVIALSGSAEPRVRLLVALRSSR